MNKKVSVIIFGIIVISAAGWLIISYNNAPGKTGSQAQFVKAPDFLLNDYNGNTVSLADFTGKPVVINSWAAWCVFCRKELIDFAAVQKEFGDKIKIVAINRAESKDVAKQYTDELDVTDNMIFLLNPNDSFYKSLNGFSMPETIFVNENGDIVIHKRGTMDIQEMRDKIKQLLQ